MMHYGDTPKSIRCKPNKPPQERAPPRHFWSFRGSVPGVAALGGSLGGTARNLLREPPALIVPPFDNRHARVFAYSGISNTEL
jgi:hypothetical protein